MDTPWHIPELWYWNPAHYMNFLTHRQDARNFIWSQGFIDQYNIDPIKHAEIHLGNSRPWRVLVTANNVVREYQFGDKLSNPCAVYPNWWSSSSFAELAKIAKYNVGDSEELCSNNDVDSSNLPTFGQSHEVFVTIEEKLNSEDGKAVWREIDHLRKISPAKIRLGKPHAVGWQLKQKLSNIIVPAYSMFKYNNFILPTGKAESPNFAIEQFEAWTAQLGYKITDITGDNKLESRSNFFFDILEYTNKNFWNPDLDVKKLYEEWGVPWQVRRYQSSTALKREPEFKFSSHPNPARVSSAPLVLF